MNYNEVSRLYLKKEKRQNLSEINHNEEIISLIKKILADVKHRKKITIKQIQKYLLENDKHLSYKQIR